MSKRMTRPNKSEEENSMSGDNGNQTDTNPTPPANAEFLSSLGEDLSGHESLANIADAQTLAKSYIEAQDALGGAMKPPETADAYSEVTAPDGVTLNDDAVNGFKAVAHELGLSDEAYGKVVGYQLDMIKQANDAIAKENADTIAALKQEQGDAFEDNVVKANQALKAFPELQALMAEPDESGEYTILRTSPKWFKAMLAIAEKITLPKQPGSEAANQGGRPKDAAGNPRMKYEGME
jgi:hypothetical protein